MTVRLRSGQALRLARHEWLMIFRDPRFLIPFAAIPLFLIALHGVSTLLFAGDASQRWLLTRTFLSVLSLIGAASAVPLGADAFAGEKERQTWETLLCLPLPRRDLFLGKVLGFLPFPLLVGWTSQLMALALSLFSGSFQFAEPSDWIFPLLLTPLLSLFFCALSALISMRCETVRSAAQLTGLSLLVLFPAISISSQAFIGNAMYQIGVLGILFFGAMICFALAARKLKS